MIMKPTSIQKKSILAQCMCLAGAGAAATRNTPCAPAPLAPRCLASGTNNAQHFTRKHQNDSPTEYVMCTYFLNLKDI